MVGSGGVCGVGGRVILAVTGWGFFTHGNPNVIGGSGGRLIRSARACGSAREGLGGGVPRSVSQLVALLTMGTFTRPERH